MTLPVLRGQSMVLRPLTEEDVATLADAVHHPSIAPWWGSIGDAEKVREDMRFDGTAFAVEVEGELAGWVAVDEERDPDWMVASLDILMLPGFQDRGLGPDALRIAIRWLIAERGHRRFTIDPAADNARAIRAYEAVGFRPVGILRAAAPGQDGGWRDALLMDLLAGELIG